MSESPHPKSNLADLTDDRRLGEWKTRFETRAWCQIVLELVYLLIVLGSCSALILWFGFTLSLNPEGSKIAKLAQADITVSCDLIQWLLVVLSGTVGGCIFVMKWLYHSVAKGLWSVDRVLWRLLVPSISGVVSVFLAFAIISGLVPFIKNNAFQNTYFSLGFGFLFGYFSDHVIAAMQNFAQNYIGTVKEDHPKD